MERLKLQKNEFNAMNELAKKWKVLQQVAIVDDDYPEMRHYYECALRDFLTACKANGRTM